MIGHIILPLALLHLSLSTLTQLLDRWGYPIVAAFVGVESSGIPFPGETMLLTAAVYAGAGHLAIPGVIAAAALGAIVGDNLGYVAGGTGGHAFVAKYGGYVHIRPEHLARAERFFQRYGDRTVFFGRFIAILRAWAAFLAGVNRMPWPKFLVFNAAGGILWATLYGLLGYFLGSNLPLLHRVVRVLGVGGVVIAIVVAAVIVLIVRRRRKTDRDRDATVVGRGAA